MPRGQRLYVNAAFVVFQVGWAFIMLGSILSTERHVENWLAGIGATLLPTFLYLIVRAVNWKNL